MYVTISDFIKEWNRETMLTQNVLNGLTDESLKQQVYPEGRTLGRIAWHLTTNITDYLSHFGFRRRDRKCRKCPNLSKGNC